MKDHSEGGRERVLKYPLSTHKNELTVVMAKLVIHVHTFYMVTYITMYKWLKW